MPREHFNDVPGDIVASAAEDLPGGFGTEDPDLNADADLDEVVANDVVSPFSGRIASFPDQRERAIAGTGYAHAEDSGGHSGSRGLAGRRRSPPRRRIGHHRRRGE